MYEISELQKKRALNIIWNTAQNYQLHSDFKAYDENGAANLYWNCIIGAVYKHYDFPLIEAVFASFAQYEDADVYTGLLWLGLENCVYGREVEERPVLAALRREYAQQYLMKCGRTVDDYHLYECLMSAHFMRVLGETPHMHRYDITLLDELEFSPEMNTEEIVAQARRLFLKWFQIRTEEKKHEKHGLHIPGLHKRRNHSDGRIWKFGLGFAECEDLSQGSVGEQAQQELRTTMSASELRAFMAAKYGRSVYSDAKIQEIEHLLCRNNHADCHLHFTKGESAEGKIQNAFEALQREKERAQIEKNRRFYRDNLQQNRTAISRLADKIQNSVLLYLQPDTVKSNSGLLDGHTVWRALELDDERVFHRTEQGNMGDLCVDILLDASTSQMDRQEIVSSQGYMIAEALTRCGIPCRVISFCSMTGYTILRIYRDYLEPQANSRIFDYVSNGCNRDGLALRAAHHLIEQAPYEHRMLILLSDVHPNDIIKIQTLAGEDRVPYEGDAGIKDTALEVRKARADGISVICVYTGTDEDLPNAKLVYGSDFARIQSLGQMADTVGKLIQNQIRNL